MFFEASGRLQTATELYEGVLDEQPTNQEFAKRLVRGAGGWRAAGASACTRLQLGPSPAPVARQQYDAGRLAG
jgi:hypothetical protein